MKINCIDKDVSEVLRGGFYTIPRFQRPYSWDPENIEDFWEDVVVNSGPAYFIGSMVLYPIAGVLGVVDGQQRLTTITLLLCALRQAFEASGMPDLAQGIHNLIERPDIDNKPRYVLATESSYPYFQECVQKFGPPDVAIEPGPEESLLQKAFDYFAGQVMGVVTSVQSDGSRKPEAKRREIQSRLQSIRDKVLSLKLIYIQIDNEDDAYDVFETLNTRGKDLTVTDLVKNHLSRLIKAKNSGVDLTKDRWNRMREMLESSEADLQVDRFLYHFWMSQYDYVTEKKLFKAIRKRVTKSNASEFLRTLESNAKTYRQVHETKYRDWHKQDLDIRASLDALNLFRVAQPTPMVLTVMAEYDSGNIKHAHAAEILRAIECFHFMFTAVTSQRSSGGIAFMYAYHARNLRSAGTTDDKVSELKALAAKLRARVPGFQEFEANFGEKLVYSKSFTKQKKLVQYALGRIDAFHSSGTPVDYERMTIEHLASEHPKSATLPARVVAQFGNLILTDEQLNNELANKSFPAKKALLAQSSVWLGDLITDAPDWGEGEIVRRTNALAQLAYDKVWSF